jgi:hypothetical protein
VSSVPPETIQPMPASYDVPWNEMMLKADKAITDLLMLPAPTLALETDPIVSAATITKEPGPSQTISFMQGRPDGPHQLAEQALRSRVST